MSLRLEMLQVARLAPRLLGPSAESVRAYVTSQLAGGACPGRDGRPDLYYTVFAVDCLHALQAPVPAPSVVTSADGDMVDLACCARLSAAVAGSVPSDAREELSGRVRALRRGDGGFAAEAGAGSSTVYASFLALGALQDLGEQVDDGAGLARFVLSAADAAGGFALGPGVGVATTPTTAAAVTVLHQLGVAAPGGTAGWLGARASGRGGFVAAPGTVVPDLLSTAVALHALATLQAPLEGFREPCLDFVDTLWTSRGGFFGHWAEDTLDCEYTFYGLLALGHLT